MNLPGFTAETSLYETSGHGQMARILIRVDASIRPAFFSAVNSGNLLCFNQCLRTCPRDRFGRAGSFCVQRCIESCGRPSIPSVYGPRF